MGAPPEVVARLSAARQEFESRQRSSSSSRDTSKDPELDQFMVFFFHFCIYFSRSRLFVILTLVFIFLDGINPQEAYYDMLVKYREELTRPIQEAMDFIRRIETQLNVLSNGSVRIFNAGTFFYTLMHTHIYNITLMKIKDLDFPKHGKKQNNPYKFHRCRYGFCSALLVISKNRFFSRFQAPECLGNSYNCTCISSIH